MDIKNLTTQQAEAVKLVNSKTVACHTSSYGHDMWTTEGQYLGKQISATLTGMVATGIITLRRRRVTVYAINGTVNRWIATVTLEKAK